MNTGYAPGRKSPPAIFGRQCSFSIGNEGRPELRRCSEAQRAARRGGPSGFGLVSFSGHEATNIRSVVGGEDRIDAIGLVDSAERREDYGQIYLAGGSTGNRAEWERCGKNQLCLAAAPFHCRNQGETVQTAALCGCVPCIGDGKLPALGLVITILLAPAFSSTGSRTGTGESKVLPFTIRAVAVPSLAEI